MRWVLQIVNKTENVSLNDLGYLARAVTQGKIENKKLIEGIIKSASFSQCALPMHFYKYFKAVRYIAGVRYPSHNYDYFDIRCYHPE